jgi:drug/metabolite transporter (DMT)-like permease
VHALLTELGGKRVAALLAVYVIWGSTYLGIRIVLESMPPFASASARFLLAGGLFYAWARLRGAGRPTPVQWRSAAIVGALLFLGGNGLVVWSEQWLASGMVAMLIATEPLMIALLLGVWPGETNRPGWRTYAALAVGFAGALLLALGGGVISEEPGPWYASWMVILATACWAVGSLYGRDAPAPDNAWLATGMQMFAGGVWLGALALARDELAGLDPGSFSRASVLAFFYLMVFGSMVAFGAYSWLLRTTHPTVISTYAYVNPVIAVLLGWLLVDEPVDARTILASVLILGAVVVVLERRSEKGAELAVASPPEACPLDADAVRTGRVRD